MPQLGSENMKALQHSDWEDLLPRLLLYAKLRIKKLALRDPEGVMESSNELAEDIVMQSIEQAISGARRWPESMNCFDFLRRLIDSNVLNTYERFKAQEKVEEQLSKIEANEKLEDERFFDLVAKEIQTELANDPIAHKIVNIILSENIIKESEIAERLKMSVDDIYQAKRRIRKSLSKFKLAGALVE